jgi:hypothetical protein
LLARRLSQPDLLLTAPPVTRVTAFSTTPGSFMKLLNFRCVLRMGSRPCLLYCLSVPLVVCFAFGLISFCPRLHPRGPCMSHDAPCSAVNRGFRKFGGLSSLSSSSKASTPRTESLDPARPRRGASVKSTGSGDGNRTPKLVGMLLFRMGARVSAVWRSRCGNCFGPPSFCVYVLLCKALPAAMHLIASPHGHGTYTVCGLCCVCVNVPAVPAADQISPAGTPPLSLPSEATLLSSLGRDSAAQGTAVAAAAAAALSPAAGAAGAAGTAGAAAGAGAVPTPPSPDVPVGARAAAGEPVRAGRRRSGPAPIPGVTPAPVSFANLHLVSPMAVSRPPTAVAVEGADGGGPAGLDATAAAGALPGRPGSPAELLVGVRPHTSAATGSGAGGAGAGLSRVSSVGSNLRLSAHHFYSFDRGAAGGGGASVGSGSGGGSPASGRPMRLLEPLVPVASVTGGASHGAGGHHVSLSRQVRLAGPG